MRRVAGWSLVLVGTVPAALGVVLFPAAVVRLIDGVSPRPSWQALLLLPLGLTVEAAGFVLVAPNGGRPLGSLALRALGMALLVGGPLYGVVWTGLATFDAGNRASSWPQGWAIAACGLALLLAAVLLERRLPRGRSERPST